MGVFVNQRLANRYDALASLAWSAPARTLKFPRRFVIITSGRSGSELLTSVLDSHPAIVSEGEILQRPRRYPALYLRGHALRMVLRARRGRFIPSVHGWKLITNHVRWHPEVFPDPRAFIEHLAADGEIVHLRRRNLLNQALSLVHAELSQYHARRGEARATFEPRAIEPERLLAQLYHYDDDDRWLTKLVADIPHIDLTYEDDLVDEHAQQVTANMLFRELGVPPAEIDAELFKVAPPDPRERVSNLVDVTRALAGTRYEEYLS
jgi:LPS sulfotransferase NodH